MQEENIVTVRIYEYEKDELVMARSSVTGTREYQQDTTFLHEEKGNALAIVCDGMGGLEGGEKASFVATKQLAEAYFTMIDGESIPQFLKDAIQKINGQILSLRNDKGMLLDCGTTMVAAIIQKGMLYWANVGDSRIYFYRNGQMNCLTRDHNYFLLLENRLKNQEITQKVFLDEQEKGDALISYLGIDELTILDVSEAPISLKAGDKVILCSDGLYKALTELQMIALINRYKDDTQKLACALTNAATELSHRGQDNTSVIVISYLGGNREHDTLP